MPHPGAGRVLTPIQVAEELATSEVQIIAMLRRGDIRALGRGHGPWRSSAPNSRRTSSGATRKRARDAGARDAYDGESADEDYRQEEGGEG